MELGDTSDEEASPPQPKKREMSKNQRIQMVLMLQMLQTEDGMRWGAFTIVAECFGMAHLTVHCLWNRVMHTHASGHIISLEFHSPPPKNVGDSSFDGALLTEQGNAHVHIWPYYLSRISFPTQKLWETAYVSIGVHL